jgi:hypothetical protein
MAYLTTDSSDILTDDSDVPLTDDLIQGNMSALAVIWLAP